MNRRNFITLAALVPALMPPLPGSPPKPRRILKSPKAMAEGSCTPMVKLAAPPPANVVVQVLPGQFGITSIAKAGPNVTVTWQNGTGPFQVQHRASLSGAWSNIGPRTTLRSVTVSDGLGFDTFRVQGFVGGASATLNPDNTVHLTWTVPEV